MSTIREDDQAAHVADELRSHLYKIGGWWEVWQTDSRFWVSVIFRSQDEAEAQAFIEQHVEQEARG